jgi:hypothetical protein
MISNMVRLLASGEKCDNCGVTTGDSLSRAVSTAHCAFDQYRDRDHRGAGGDYVLEQVEERHDIGSVLSFCCGTAVDGTYSIAFINLNKWLRI